MLLIPDDAGFCPGFNQGESSMAWGGSDRRDLAGRLWNRPERRDADDMTRSIKPPRERAARALCNLEGNPPDIMFEGAPMWVSYLPQVDAVLRVALGDDVWQAMIEAERAGAAGSP